MSDRVKELGDEARKLSMVERASLVEDILASMDKPDDKIDAIWGQEAERRLALVDSGEMSTRDAKDVIEDLRRSLER